MIIMAWKKWRHLKTSCTFRKTSRGFNNPHLVVIDPVEGGVNVRVEHTASYDVPGMGQGIMVVGDE